MLAPEATREPAAADLDGAQQQDDAQRELGELQQRGEEADVRQNDAFDEPGKDAAVRARIRADELVEVLDIVRIRELVEAGQNELDAQRSLDQR